jgi:HB1, ASXL, restriction endonuclease HTH domain
MDDLERLETTITQTKARLAEMEIAARVLREMRATYNGSARRPSLKGAASHEAAHAVVAKTITDHAREILATAGSGGMHFKAIAEKAIEHGYKGKGKNEKSIRQAFWATMRRNTDTFKALGGGKFALT